MQPAIYGLSGARLTPDERDFFTDANPAGYILFKRNCVDPEQVRALTGELRALHGRDALPILVDQEGGRVARLQPPNWPAFPGADRFDALYQVAPMSAIEAARANAQAIAALLRDCGINVNCMPVLDVRHPGAHPIIADRALGPSAMQVAALGRALLEGLAAGGVVGVIKHMPGHGRAAADSHHELPVVEASDEELEADLHPFRTLRSAAMGMVAHVVYQAWDPDHCASLSPAVIGGVIRGRIGFGGFLLSDDIEMAALSGTMAERARGVIAAGCDAVLHCSGKLSEMAAVAGALGTMGEDAVDRLRRAMSVTAIGAVISYEDAAARRDALLGYAG